MSHGAAPPESGYRRIVEALDEGRRALARARLTAGLIRFAGVLLATLAALVLWAVLQRTLRFYSVPVASAASLLGAGVVVFALVRWVVIPLVRMPGRDRFVAFVEARFPEEKNLIVNAYQLGNPDRREETASSRDLVDALVARAAGRIGDLDLRRWRNPAPDRPFLWAAGAAVLVVVALGAISPTLLGGALGQVIRPALAKAPPVALVVTPGDVEIDRGGDVEIRAAVTGTGSAPSLRFRERNGEWRVREFLPESRAAVTRESGRWTASLEDVDRNLEYKVEAPRAESPVYAVRVKEPPRIAGFRAHLVYPPYTGLPPETIEGGAGDIAALKGTAVDLRVLTNRDLDAAWIDWQADGSATGERRPLERLDGTTWGISWSLLEGGNYAVVFADAAGREVLRSARYRVEPAPDRAPHLTLHLPGEDHDLYADMMEKVVADAADDFGFSAVRIVYRVDDGAERSTSFHPFTAGQKEFRLDTLWDLSTLDLLPGSTLTFHVEVRDNDAVNGPKAARSEVRRVRFPTVDEMYAEVAEEHDREIAGLSEVHQEQENLRERLEKLSDDLKAGKDLNWELRQDLQSALDRQAQLEQQVAEAMERLGETASKASDRAGMNQELVDKMNELNRMLKELDSGKLERAFERLSDALTRMNRDQLREALENYRASQEEMLQGVDRTVELLKQIRREEQMEDVVRRTDEIAALQEEIAKELEKMGLRPEAESPEDAARDEAADSPEGEKSDAETGKEGEPREEEADGAQQERGDERAGREEEKGEQENRGERGDGEMTPEMQSLLEEIRRLEEQIAEERAEYMNRGLTEAERRALEAEARKRLEDLRAELERRAEEARGDERGAESRQQDGREQSPQQGQQQQGQQQQGQQQQSQQQQGRQQQGDQSQSGEPQKGEESSKSPKSAEEKLRELARREQELAERVEELKRQLEMLRKLNREDQALAQDLEELESGETTRRLQQSLMSAQQSMQSGQKQKSSKYAFRARDEARELAQTAQQMQQQMEQRMEDDSTEKMEAIIRGLIDVSGVGEALSGSEETDDSELAGRQFFLLERTQAWSESLLALARQSFAVRDQEMGKLGEAMRRMERATRLYEQGDIGNGRHEGRESTSDLNETIVELMQSHQQMCGGKSGGGQMQQMLEKMRGLSEAQQGLNEQTGSMARRNQGRERLGLNDEERMKWLAAQQEMIRKGLQELQEEHRESRELLGDLDKLGEDMAEVEQSLAQGDLDRELLERQQQILSRLLDAQRSIRQQEMSPERESRTGTLVQRRSPPEIPESLLRPDRTLEEDVLRGANDRYPAQYRRLVEEYFRALSREVRTP